MSSTDSQKQEITAILEVIVEQTETILSFEEGQIPQIELDLVNENIRKLYTNYTLLNKLNSKLMDRLTDAIVDETVKNKPILEADLMTEDVNSDSKNRDVQSMVNDELAKKTVPVSENLSLKEEYQPPIIIRETPKEAIPVEISATPINTPSTPISEAKTEDKPAQIIEIEQITTPKTHAEPKPKNSKTVANHHENTSIGNLFEGANSTSVADQFKNDKKSLYQKIGANSEDHSLADKLQQKPISDLVKSIGINDRFLLIKELFKNNGEEYNEAMQLLNNFSTITQAFDYLDVLKQKFAWDENSSASLKLFDLVRRKYQ